MIEFIGKVAEFLDKAFLMFSLVFAVSAMIDGRWYMAGLWFIVHGVWCCSMHLVNIQVIMTGKDYITGQVKEDVKHEDIP